MKIAFYIDNENHKGVDYSNPEKGNPGIGGTHFMFWTVAFYLQKMYPHLEIIILAPLIDSMPAILKCYESNSPKNAVEQAAKMNVDILVLRGPNSSKELFKEIEVHKQTIIFWSHNPEDYRFATLAAKCKYVKRNVCVGKEQMDRLRDHELYNKTTYIYNALDFSLYNGYERTAHTKIVGYMGSLTPKKGFHRLAKIWKDVLVEVPDAQLYVLGGGNLYGKEWKTGKLNLTNDRYEKKILKYLSDSNGKLQSSVKFMGVVSGEKKLELLKNLNVGVANPVGNETFCIVAVEYQYLKVPVVTVRKDGVLDTVRDHVSGLLFKSDKEFVQNLVHLLNSPEKVDEIGESGHRFVLENFEIHDICKQWYELFYNINNEENNLVKYDASNWDNNFKWLREINRRVKRIRILSWLPSILIYKQIVRDIYKKIKNSFR